MKPIQLEDGAWYKCGEEYIHVCCDCGLAHKVVYQMIDGQLFYSWTRSPQASTAERKAFPFDFVPRKVKRGRT